MNVNITRRELLAATSALALIAVVRSVPAAADTVPMADLMQPSTLGDIALGAENAPVTIVEYASMTCSHCAHFATTTFPELKKKYIDTGKVRFILREFPLDALAAAGFMLARCAGKDKYYSLVDTLFEQQPKWAVQKPIPPLMAIAKQAGFTEESFDACLKNQKLLDQLEEVRNRGSQKFKVESTPTFFINGERVVGAVPLEQMEKVIQTYLKT
jgi:protein-disulfide isomerase